MGKRWVKRKPARTEEGHAAKAHQPMERSDEALTRPQTLDSPPQIKQTAGKEAVRQTTKNTSTIKQGIRQTRKHTDMQRNGNTDYYIKSGSSKTVRTNAELNIEASSEK